ncbi:unnamed protein product [Camellia sinensis]
MDLIGAGSTPLHYAACGGNLKCCQASICPIFDDFLTIASTSDHVLVYIDPSCKRCQSVDLKLQWEHVEGYHELSAKTKIFLSTAVAKWDADFYVKVDDDVDVDLGRALGLRKKATCSENFLTSMGKEIGSTFQPNQD